MNNWGHQDPGYTVDGYDPFEADEDLYQAIMTGAIKLDEAPEI